MSILFMGVLALLLTFVAIYAHHRVALFTQGTSGILISRLILLVVGVLFGWMGALGYEDPLAQLFSFLIGFGLVHLPAAIILFIKGRRGAGRS